MEVVRKESMFVLQNNGANIGRLMYKIHDDYIDAFFIGVVEEYRGTKAKNYLLDEFIKLINTENKKIVCTCSWMQRWFTKHHSELLK